MSIEQIKAKAKDILISLDCSQGNELIKAKKDYKELQDYYFNNFVPTEDEFFKMFGFAVWDYYTTNKN